MVREPVHMETRLTQDGAQPLDSPCISMTFEDNVLARSLLGEHNQHIRRIAHALGIEIHAKGNTVSICGDAIATALARKLLGELYDLLGEGYPIYPSDIDYAIRILSGDDRVKLKDIFLDTVYITSQKRPITPKGLAKRNTLTPYESMTSSLVLDRLALARPILPWPWLFLS